VTSEHTGSPPIARALAVAATIVAALLVMMGGLVTSRNAGMVFPDWPLSNGSVNPEGWLRNADMFSEHGHRILGTILGILVVATAVLLQRSDPRRFMRALGWATVLAVGAQGVLGGLRVTRADVDLALVHGCTGLLVFALIGALAYFAGRDRPERGAPDGRPVAFLAAGVWIVTMMQAILGARVRHIGGPINEHFLGALVVTGSVLWLATRILLEQGPALRRPAVLLLLLVAGQIVLGLWSASVLSPDNTDATAAHFVLPTAHQTLGGILLAVESLIVLRAWRRRRPVAAMREIPA